MTDFQSNPQPPEPEVISKVKHKILLVEETILEAEEDAKKARLALASSKKELTQLNNLLKGLEKNRSLLES